MSSLLVDDDAWEALYSTDAPEVPFDAISELMEKCRQNPEVEDEIVAEFKAILDDKEDDFGEELYWIMVVLAKAGSRKSISLFLRCLSRYPDYDYVLEAADQCLIWLGEPGVREVMTWLKEKRSFVEKLYASGAFGNVLDYGDESLLNDVKQFLKDQVTTEESIEDNEDCLSQFLMALAYFPGEDVLSFVRSVVSRYEFHPELNDAFEVAEGRFPIERENEYTRDWRKFCELYAERLDPGRERKDRDHQKYIEDLFQEMKKAIEIGNWNQVITLGKSLKKESSFEMKLSSALCSAYLNLRMQKEFEAEVKEALEQVNERWNILPAMIDYRQEIEAFEVLRNTSEFASEDDRLFLISRFGDYMVGFLHHIGFAAYETAIKKIKKMVNMPDAVSDGLLRDFFQTNDRTFILKDKYIALKFVEDVDLLISEFDKRKLSPIFPNSLTKIKLMEEGRSYEIYTKKEKMLDQDIRILTLGGWNLEAFRVAMRNDIVGFTGRDKLIEKMQVYFENFQELVECVLETWNISPRWELGGRAPENLKINNRPAGAMPEMKPMVKPGRNEPCFCGSGKKYKKCCGH